MFHEHPINRSPRSSSSYRCNLFPQSGEKAVTVQCQVSIDKPKFNLLVRFSEGNVCPFLDEAQEKYARVQCISAVIQWAQCIYNFQCLYCICIFWSLQCIMQFSLFEAYVQFSVLAANMPFQCLQRICNSQCLQSMCNYSEGEVYMQYPVGVRKMLFSLFAIYMQF